jgi:uncharacterized protein (TIGR03118 family)
MKAKRIGTQRDVIPMVSLVGAASLLAASAAPVSADTLFNQLNLVSNIPHLANITDPNLVNAWGISESSGSPFWISDNGMGLTTLYSVAPSGPPNVGIVPLVVTIPGAVPNTASAPTGQVFNLLAGSGAFKLSNGNPALFIFASEDGAISGWNPTLPPGPPPATMAEIEKNNNPGAVYKGLAISNFDSGTGPGTLYAANFRAGTIDAFDSSFNQTLAGPGDFVDPNLPAGYAPFNDKVINGELYVTYAVQDALKHDDVPGQGHGIVDIFNLNGAFDERLVSNGPTSALNSPWGMEIAPSSFGRFAGDLLVGNFGDGMINAYNATDGTFIGTLDGSNGNPLVIDGLWALTIGNNGSGGSSNKLYFTAGPNGESDGLFGTLSAAPEPSTWAMMLLGFAGLSFAGYRHGAKARQATA